MRYLAALLFAAVAGAQTTVTVEDTIFAPNGSAAGVNGTIVVELTGFCTQSGFTIRPAPIKITVQNGVLKRAGNSGTVGQPLIPSASCSEGTTVYSVRYDVSGPGGKIKQGQQLYWTIPGTGPTTIDAIETTNAGVQGVTFTITGLTGLAENEMLRGTATTPGIATLHDNGDGVVTIADADGPNKLSITLGSAQGSTPAFEIKDTGGNTLSEFIEDGSLITRSTNIRRIAIFGSTIQGASGMAVQWKDNAAVQSGSVDLALSRSAANTLTIDNGLGGTAYLKIGGMAASRCVQTDSSGVLSTAASACAAGSGGGDVTGGVTLSTVGKVPRVTAGSTLGEGSLSDNADGVVTLYDLDGPNMIQLRAGSAQGSDHLVGFYNNANELMTEVDVSGAISFWSTSGGYRKSAIQNAGVTFASDQVLTWDDNVSMDAGSVDFRMRRTAAKTLTIDDGSAGAITLSILGATSAQRFDLTGDISPTQLSANTDDWAPTGLSTASVIRFSTDASRNITGLTGGADGRIVALVNVGAQDAVIKNSDTGSTAANRFLLSADVTLTAEQSMLAIYDATSSRWRQLGGSGAGGGIGDITSVAAGTCMSGGGASGAVTLSLDLSACVASLSFFDGSQASRTFTINLTGTDPVITFASGSVNVSTGALQQGGTQVLLDPGGNGLVKRTALGVSTAATAGTDYVVSLAGTTSEITVSGASGVLTASLPAAIDLGGKTSFEIPNGAAPTVNVFGQIACDNDTWAASRGTCITYDGTAVTRFVNVLASDIPTNGQVPTWNTGGMITWETNASGVASSIISSSTLPATCTAGEIYFDTDATNRGNICHTTDTWRQFLTTTFSSGEAGFVAMTQGTAPTPATNEVVLYAPTSVTAYKIALPTTVGVTGLVHAAVSGTTATYTHSLLVNADITNATIDLTTKVTGVLPVANGGTGLASGTSGGILAYTASGTLASSGALTANLPVIGGGAGVAPTVGTRSGNTTAFVTTTGSQTSGDCVKIDANGNHIANGSACGGGAAATTGSSQIPWDTFYESAGSLTAANRVRYQKFTPKFAQTLTHIDIRTVTATTGGVVVGIYNEACDTKLAEKAVNTPGNAVTHMALSASVSLVPTSNYYIAFAAEDAGTTWQQGQANSSNLIFGGVTNEMADGPSGTNLATGSGASLTLPSACGTLSSLGGGGEKHLPVVLRGS